MTFKMQEIAKTVFSQGNIFKQYPPYKEKSYLYKERGAVLKHREEDTAPQKAHKVSFFRRRAIGICTDTRCPKRIQVCWTVISGGGITPICNDPTKGTSEAPKNRETRHEVVYIFSVCHNLVLIHGNERYQTGSELLHKLLGWNRKTIEFESVEIRIKKIYLTWLLTKELMATHQTNHKY